MSTCNKLHRIYLSISFQTDFKSDFRQYVWLYDDSWIQIIISCLKVLNCVFLYLYTYIDFLSILFVFPK